MDTPKLKAEIEQLFLYHKQAIALDDEYTDEIYDYLKKSGIIVLKAEEKVAIFEQVKLSFMKELKNITEVGDYKDAKNAVIIMAKLKRNSLEPDEQAKLWRICKRTIIKQYFPHLQQSTGSHLCSLFPAGTN